MREIFKLALIIVKFRRPAIAVTQHPGNDIADGHPPMFQRDQRLIHVGVDLNGSPLTCTRHDYHWVVIVYKHSLKNEEISTGLENDSPSYLFTHDLPAQANLMKVKVLKSV